LAVESFFSEIHDERKMKTIEKCIKVNGVGPSLFYFDTKTINDKLLIASNELTSCDDTS